MDTDYTSVVSSFESVILRQQSPWRHSYAISNKFKKSNESETQNPIKMNRNDPYSVPRKMSDIYEALINITDAFCQTHLNQEYADLCRKMAAALSRKRPSPLENGRLKSWAAGIVYALGQVNFLFDKSQEPYMSATDLCEKIGVSQSTATNKSREIWNRLELMPLHPEWSLSSLLEMNPLAWMISVNGLIVDARRLPRELQEEAYGLGLIPYVPEQVE